MRRQGCSCVVMMAMMIGIFLTGCAGSSQFKKDPEVMAAKHRLQVAEKAYEASKEEYQALLRKKKADQSKLKADQQLAEAKDKSQVAVSEARRVYQES